MLAEEFGDLDPAGLRREARDLIGSAKPDDRIATADPDILAVARAEKLDSVALPGQG